MRCQHPTGRLERLSRYGDAAQRSAVLLLQHGEPHLVSLLTWPASEGHRLIHERLLSGLHGRRRQDVACVRCTASRTSSASSPAQHATAGVCRRDFLAIGTAAIMAGVTSVAAAASAATSLPPDHGPAVPQQSGAPPLWELSAASASSSGERADLVSPTVLPQLSASERQVRNLSRCRGLVCCHADEVQFFSAHSRGRLPCTYVWRCWPQIQELAALATRPTSLLVRRFWSITSASRGKTASPETSLFLSGKASQ